MSGASFVLLFIVVVVFIAFVNNKAKKEDNFKPTKETYKNNSLSVVDYQLRN